MPLLCHTCSVTKNPVCELMDCSFQVGSSHGIPLVSFYLGNGAQGCRLFKLVVAECTRLTGCPLVGLGLLQPQMFSFCWFLHIRIHTRLMYLHVMTSLAASIEVEWH